MDGVWVTGAWLSPASGGQQALALTVQPDTGLIPAGDHTVYVSLDAEGADLAMAFSTRVTVTSLTATILACLAVRRAVRCAVEQPRYREES